MSLRSWLAEVIKPAEVKDKVADLVHERWTGSRLVLLLAFAGLLIYITKGMLTEHNIDRLFWALAIYMICNTVSKVAVIIGNAWLKVWQTRAFMKDGKLDDNERAILNAETTTKN